MQILVCFALAGHQLLQRTMGRAGIASHPYFDGLNPQPGQKIQNLLHFHRAQHDREDPEFHFLNVGTTAAYSQPADSGPRR